MTAGALAAEGPSFRLSDSLGRHWEHELVEHDLTGEQVESIADRRLVDHTGREVLYQLDADNGTVVFQADVEPNSESTYTFVDGEPTVATDLTVRETEDYIEIANARTGIRLARALDGETTQTPLLSWRLASGEWAGRTEFEQPQPIANYTVSVVQRGPVRARVVSTLRFEGGAEWTVTAELRADEPVVKIHEQFSSDRHRDFRFIFDDGFDPAYSLSRSGANRALDGDRLRMGDYLLREIDELQGDILRLQPWVKWGGDPARTSSFNLIDKDWGNQVLFATSQPTRWVDPDIDRNDRAPALNSLQRTGKDEVALSFTLATGEREYLIGSVPGNIDRQNYESEQRVPTQAQRYQMKYSDFPLNRVKDYVLAWPTEGRGTIGFLSQEHRQQLLEGLEFDENQIARLLKRGVGRHNLENALPAYLVTGDEVIERQLIESALNSVQGMVHRLTRLEGNVITVGSAPHHYRSFITTCNVLATVYDSPQIIQAERRQLDAQLAFLGYLFNRDAMCSVERGFNGFPNMTASVYGIRAAIATVTPNHPMQATWMERGAGSLRKMFLEKWTDEHGDWIGTRVESIHYSRLTLDILLAVLYQAHASGIEPGAIYHPTMRKMGQWYAGVATPRDERILDWRHDPPVGHVYRFETLSSQFGIFAFLWKDHDPEFAAHMKWMQLQQGNQQVNSVGGFLPSFAGYRKLFMANDVEPKAPSYTSQHWKESSVILRSHYNDELENMLYMIAGRGHSHYDRDSGSITLWGKGEIIADDFGYYGYAPGEDHNMLESLAAPAAQLMHVSDFQTSPVMDYVRGRKRLWTRRALHLKHDDPAGPNYYVLHDTLQTPAPAAWRLWLSADDVQIDGHRATVSGLFRVDSDIHFARVLDDATFTTEDKTREGYGLAEGDAKYGKQQTTQTGIILKTPRFGDLLTLVYPRLKDEASPEVTAIADGKGFRITTQWGTDYVLAADEPFRYEGDGLTFEGTVGFARIADGEDTLDLKEGGRIAYGDQELTEEPPDRPEASSNLYPDGEMTRDAFSVFRKTDVNARFDVTMIDESPIESDQLNGFGLRIESRIADKSKWRSAMPWVKRRLFVDPTKSYRVSVRAYVPGENRIRFSSYAHDGKSQIENDAGRTWTWGLTIPGPTDGFETFETTIGPAGSGADHIFPDGVAALNSLKMRMYDQSDDVFYLDDLVIQIAEE
ncbi:MAG: hypothetical protein ACOC9P_01030 [bacterium]